MDKHISVLGAGSWGATMAHHLANRGLSVTLWSKFEQEIAQIKASYSHPFIQGLSLNKTIDLTSNLEKAIVAQDIIFIAIPSHFVRDLSADISGLLRKDQLLVILSKGIENNSLLSMSQVIREAGKVDLNNIITLYGPSHAEEVAIGMPTTLVSASVNQQNAKVIQNAVSSSTLRVYTNSDILGVELGGSLKNVFAVAAGICDGIGYGDNTKAALMTRGMYEMIRLGEAMGANKETFQGLSGIGDVIVTCLSQHSRNRYVGEKIGKGHKLEEILNEMDMVAEGVKMAKSVHQLKEKYQVEMPISEAVYNILFNHEDPKKEVTRLMTRGLVAEH